jgi:transposase
MDNATFHKGGRIEQWIRAAGAHLVYLPPYSPDLNKIEHCWSWLKSRIRKHLITLIVYEMRWSHVLRTVS